MKCRDARELINSYLDNGLDPEKDKFLMGHVEQCHRCREELRFIIAYRKTVKEIRPVKAPAGFMAALNKRLELENKTGIRTLVNKALDAWNNFTLPLEALGVAAVALLIFFLYTPLFHGTKKISTFNEDQVVTETQSKSIDEQIIEKRKLLPPDIKKKEQKERLSVSSGKGAEGFNNAVTDSFSEEGKAPAVMEDSISGSSKDSADDSFYNKDTGKEEAEVYRSESVKRDDSHREMKKKTLSAGEITRHSETTPERIIAEHNGLITKKEARKYTVRIEEDRLKGLSEKLKKNYSATYRIIKRSGSSITVEFFITE